LSVTQTGDYNVNKTTASYFNVRCHSLSAAPYSLDTFFSEYCSEIPDPSPPSVSPPDAACQYAPKAVAAILNVVPAALYNVISLLLVCYYTIGQ
jgi:hypothetical protein